MAVEGDVIDVAVVEIEPKFDRFQGEVRRGVKAATRDLREGTRRMERDSNTSLGRIGRDIAKFAARAGRAFRTLVLSAVKLTALAAAVGAISAALAGLAGAAAHALPAINSLVVSLISASGAAVAIPGALFGLIAVMKTVSLATQGFGNAMKELSKGDMEAFRQAIKSLSPSAREFAKTIASLQDEFKKLQKVVQEQFFKGFDKAVGGLIRKTLPTLKLGLSQIASSVNASVILSVRELDSAGRRLQLARVFSNIAASVRTLGAALAPVLGALLDVVDVGLQAIRELSGPLAGVLSSFADNIARLAATGELKQIILDGVDALKQFVGLGADLIGILRSIGRASGLAEGGDIFGFFDRLNRLLASGDVQSSLSGVFGQLREIGTALEPVFKALLKALVPVAKAIGEIAVAFSPILVKLAQQLGDALASLAPGFIALGPAVGALGDALQPVADILVGLVTGIAPGLTEFIAALAQGLANLAPAAVPVGQALGDILSALAPLLPALGDLLVLALTEVAGLLRTLAPVLQPVISAFAAMASVWAQNMIPVAQELFQRILPLAVELGTRMFEAFEPLIPAFLEIGAVIATTLIELMPEIQSAIENLLPVVVDLIDKFGEQFLQILVQIAPMLPELIQAFIEWSVAGLGLIAAILPLISVLVRVVVRGELLRILLGSLIGFMKISTLTINILKSAFNALPGVLSKVGGFFVRLGNASRDQVNRVVKWFRGLPGRILGAVGNLSRLLYDAGRNVVGGLLNGIKERAGELRDAASNLASIIRNFLPFSPAKEGPLSGRGSPERSGRAIVRMLDEGMTSELSRVRGAMGALTASMRDGFRPDSSTSSGVAFGPGAVQVIFNGAVPTPEQARQTGVAVGQGIASVLTRRSVRTQVRTA